MIDLLAMRYNTPRLRERKAYIIPVASCNRVPVFTFHKQKS